MRACHSKIQSTNRSVRLFTVWFIPNRDLNDIFVFAPATKTRTWRNAERIHASPANYLHLRRCSSMPHISAPTKWFVTLKWILRFSVFRIKTVFVSSIKVSQCCAPVRNGIQVKRMRLLKTQMLNEAISPKTFRCDARQSFALRN